MSKLFSIVIPTKDRYRYLKKCVQVLAEMELPDTEILIQDNTEDNTEIKAFLNQHDFSQVVYFHETGKLSVSQNSDLAVRNSCGEYVCFLGDDDSVAPQIVKVVEYMKDNGIEACSVACGRYNWPDLIRAEGQLDSVMVYENAAGQVEPIFGIQEMLTIMHTGVFSIGRIPKLYQGIVKRTVLEAIFKICGSYSPGASPDIANAVAVCVSSSKHIFVNSPVIISGYSYKSTSGMGARKKHVNTLENVPWLDESVRKQWEQKLPRIWTGETIWAESMLKALRRMGKEEYLKEFNYVKFYAMFIIRHRDCLSYLLKVKGGRKWLAFLYLPLLVCRKLISRLRRKKMQNYQISIVKEPVGMEMAAGMVEEYINRHPLMFRGEMKNEN